MSIPVHFDDGKCESIFISSTWRTKATKKSAECQTPSEFYEFDDAQSQSGINTRIVSELVSKKDKNLSLLRYFCEYHQNESREIWTNRIKDGAVSVDCEISTQTDLIVEPGQYLEFVDYKNDAQVFCSLYILSL